MPKSCVYLPHEVKALLELFCLQPIVFGQWQNNSSSSFDPWGKIKVQHFTLADRTSDFQKFCWSGLDRIQFYRIRTGLGLKNFTVRSSLAHMEWSHKFHKSWFRLTTGPAIFQIWESDSCSDCGCHPSNLEFSRSENEQDQDWISCRILAIFSDQDWI